MMKPNRLAAPIVYNYSGRPVLALPNIERKEPVVQTLPMILNKNLQEKPKDISAIEKRS